MLKSQFAELI